ncbi:carboxylesterase [Paraphoma chrysanthemicola]|uniref:Carboxylic ester hydrolase n=1 Tax=Paraphoma chrysanthemicola TaxID=798071 RepID=A0A8K0RJS2_9PLEO|nr:carboxylesterase [Paraphoma chrysanthemicola]
MHISLLLFVSFCLTSTSAGSSVSQDRPSATIDSGVVVGTSTAIPPAPHKIDKFLGVPFAAPLQRFSPPQKETPWQGIYDASTHKPACIQQFDFPEEDRARIIKWLNTPGPPAGESEDCLYLDIYAPPKGKEPKAVLFWIHGGVYLYGSGSLPLYDGSILAAIHDVVVVTTNYRLNVFGFPGSPEIPEGQRNLGLLDQRLALDWVQRNIAAFGGDPEQVTIFGESAGASSVDALITSPPHPLPFRAAIMQSGHKTLHPESSDSEKSWKKLIELAGCKESDALQCVRKKSALELKGIVERAALPFNPILDGVTVSKTPRRDRLSSINDTSAIARVPVMMGTNANEGSMYALPLARNTTEEFLHLVLSYLYPRGRPKGLLEALLKAYPLGEAGVKTEVGRMDRILTDVLSQCPIKFVADDSALVEIPTWRYYFDAGFSNSALFYGSGAYHSAEIEMVFGTYNTTDAPAFQVEVSRAMQKAWTDFAKDPIRGPGWGKVPEIASFGDGFRPGSSVEGKAVLEVIAEDLDKRCALYKGFYTG